MTAPTATRLTQQLEEVAAVDLTGDAEAPVAALVVSGEVVDGDTVFLPIKGRVSIEEATAEIVAAIERLIDAVNASALNTGGTVVEPWKYVGEAGEIAFDGDWENDPSLVPTVFGPLRYRKEGDVVRVEGCVSGGTPDPTSATGVTTLPAGYRPEYITVVSGASSIDNDGDPIGTATLTVTPVGTLAVAAASESAVLYFAEFVVAS